MTEGVGGSEKVKIRVTSFINGPEAYSIAGLFFTNIGSPDTHIIIPIK